MEPLYSLHGAQCSKEVPRIPQGSCLPKLLPQGMFLKCPGVLIGEGMSFSVPGGPGSQAGGWRWGGF